MITPGTAPPNAGGGGSGTAPPMGSPASGSARPMATLPPKAAVMIEERSEHVNLIADTSVTFKVWFSLRSLSFASADAGYSQMTALFSGNAASGVFNTRLQTNGAGLSSIASVSGATSAVFSSYTAAEIMLKFPTMSPTVTIAPSVSPTPQPSTRTPTRIPTTTTPTVQPTTLTPTALPTFKTWSPTLSIVPPVIALSIGSVSLNSVTLTATFDMPTVYDGYVYCAAMVEGTTVSSVSQVVLSSQSTYYPAGSTSVAVTIRSLSAVTTYDVYSYVQSTAGYGSGVSAVQATKLSTTTACCKTFSFSNSPGSVYGDVTNKYTSSSATSSYIFTYSLSAAPRSTVTVTPIFKNLDYSSSSQLAVIPASMTFTGSAASLQGSFYITASALLSGQFYVFLNTTGANALDYTTTSSLFTLLASASPIPAPKLLSSQFSDAGNFVYIAFDSATDKAGMTAN
eukprot:gene36544-biopygen31060